MRLIFLRKNILLYLLVFTVLLISSTVYAWFVKDSSIELYATGTSIVNYFARGTGEENDPYIINDKKHLYHLAWLQNLGYFGNEKFILKSKTTSIWREWRFRLSEPKNTHFTER